MFWLAACLCLSAALPDEGGPPPNILLVLLDDVGVDKLGAYGEHPHPAQTPGLDTLASHGVLFRNAWSHDTCSPTRAGLLTGRQPFRHGIGTFISTGGDSIDLSPDEVSLADVVAAVGYRTAVVGKWHLSARFAPTDHLAHPLALGFEHHRGPITNLQAKDGPNAFYDYDKAVDGVLFPELKYATTAQVDDALELIEQFEGEGDAPWLLWLAFSAPHKPLHVPPAALHSEQLTKIVVSKPNHAGGQSASQTAPAGPGGPGSQGPPSPAALPPAPGAQPADVALPLRAQPVDPATNGPAYVRGALQAVDAELSRLLSSLAPEVLANTVIIVLGDNGTESAGVEAPFDPGHAKSTVFEGGLNVPLIVSGPGIPEGAECQALVHTNDLFATVAALAGADGSAGLDALDLTPYLLDPAGPDQRGWVYCERHRPNGFGPFNLREQTARDGRFKLIRSTTFGVAQAPQLYDLLNDPFETTDLAASGQDALSLDAQASYDALLAVLAQHEL